MKGIYIDFIEYKPVEFDSYNVVFSAKSKNEIENIIKHVCNADYVSVLFIDHIDNREKYDTIISIDGKSYYCFYEWVDVY